ncbi:MAG: permease [Gemmatimonadetes bacterium]|nr:permease [Gemmatimonadota bacterium]
MGNSISQELRHTLRTLRREPALVAGVVGTFALAIGTNAVMLGLVTRLMLSPPPGIRDPHRVARVEVRRTESGSPANVMTTTSYPAFTALRGVSAFDGVAAVSAESLTVGGGADLQQAAVIAASGDYFRTLGVSAVVGRLFGPQEDELPAGSAAVVLGHAYWLSHYGGDRAVIGRSQLVAGQEFTIIGVAPAGFTGHELAPVDLFIPLSAAMRTRPPGWWSTVGMNLVSIVVRLRPGASFEQAAAMATSATRASLRSDGRSALSIGLDPVTPGSRQRDTPQSRVTLWLAAVSMIVLLIATANAGTMLLLRSVRRRREVAVRIALGATVRDLARPLVIESLVLALLGAAGGLLLSHWFGSVIRATLLPNLAPAEGFVDQRVVWISIAIACASGVLASASSLLQLRARDISRELRSGGGHGASRRVSTQNVMIGAQVALCTALLAGAGLFVRSLQRVQSQDLGFSTSGLLYVVLEPQPPVDDVALNALHRDALRRLRGVGGVRNASLVQGMPFGAHHIPAISIPGWEMPDPGLVQLPILYGASPEYLAMLKVSALAGRLFTDRDEAGAQRVVIVNETMARSIWGSPASALGRCVRAGFPAGFHFDPDVPPTGNPADGSPCRTVVGVVRDSRARSLRPEAGEARLMQYYVPFGQLPTNPMELEPHVSGLLVEVNGDARASVATVQRSVQGGAGTAVFARVTPYQELLDPQLRSRRLGAVLLSAFSALALGIAALGLFGVVSYLFAQRRQEIGVRIALGATRGRLARLVVVDSLRLVTSGIALGSVVFLAASPLLRGMLFETSPWEPAGLGSALVILVGVTVAAALWPAWHAGRVDPMLALRESHT